MRVSVLIEHNRYEFKFKAESSDEQVIIGLLRAGDSAKVELFSEGGKIETIVFVIDPRERDKPHAG